MLEMKYKNSPAKYNVLLERMSKHIVQLKGDFPIQSDGFFLSRIGQNDAWDYLGFTTIYREVEDGAWFSDDGSVYVPLDPKPNPDLELKPYVPTLEEVRVAKKQEIYATYNEEVAAGVDVELSTGVQHFPLLDEDQRFLMGKQLELYGSDSEMISYQDSDNHCMLLSRDDMQKIITKALTYVNVKTTYRNNLCEWIEQCKTIEEVEKVFYGASIPEEYQNVVFKMNLTQQGE